MNRKYPARGVTPRSPGWEVVFNAFHSTTVASNRCRHRCGDHAKKANCDALPPGGGDHRELPALPHGHPKTVPARCQTDRTQTMNPKIASRPRADLRGQSD